MATIEARKSCSGISYRAKSKTKCKHHGGRSTGSRTPEGKARQITANTKHGRETRAKREERSAKLAELYELEMLGRKLGLSSGGMVGRKALSHLIFWLEHDDEHATARSRAGIRNGRHSALSNHCFIEIFESTIDTELSQRWDQERLRRQVKKRDTHQAAKHACEKKVTRPTPSP